MPKFKYMGAADRRIFEKGENFQGRLADPLPRDVSFDWQNRHVQDSTDEANADLPAAFWDLLSSELGFQDVTNDSVMPLNDAERLWRGQRDPNDTRYARPEADNMPVYNDKFPTRLYPPPDQQLRPASVKPNTDLEEAQAGGESPDADATASVAAQEADQSVQ